MTYSKNKTTLLLLLIFPIIFSCKKDDEAPKEETKEEKADFTLSPSSAYNGMYVYILGESFSTVSGENVVTFNGVEADIIAEKEDSITVTVPVSTSGHVEVSVNGNKLNGSPTFTYTSQPSYSLITDGCSGASDVEVTSFSVDSVKQTGNNDYYTVYYSAVITNNGSVDVDLTSTLFQAYFSSDATYETSDEAAGGANLDGPTLSPGESHTFTRIANPFNLKEQYYFDLDGWFLIVKVEYDAAGCTDFVSQELNLE